MSADVRQEKVNRKIAGKILSELISHVEYGETDCDFPYDNFTESIPYSDEEAFEIKLCVVSDIDSKCTPIEKGESCISMAKNTVTSSTQTEITNLIDTSTSPFVFKDSKANKSIQCCSRGVSPINFDLSVPSDLIIKPLLKSCCVSLDKVDSTEVIDMQVGKCDIYHLRSRKSNKDH